MGSLAAENLLVGTALVESELDAMRQHGGGPALGPYQMEPATAEDIWDRYLVAHPRLCVTVRDMMTAQRGRVSELAGNWYYATALARVHYWRVPEPLPDAGDIPALAAYWKAYWNTPRGKGAPATFVERYRRFVS